MKEKDVVANREEARIIAGSVIELMLRRAFDPARSDALIGAEAAKFVFRARREGLLIVPLDEEEDAVAPPSMVDPAIAEAGDATLVAAAEICSLVARTLHRMSPKLAEHARRALSGEPMPGGPRPMAGWYCLRRVSVAP